MVVCWDKPWAEKKAACSAQSLVEKLGPGRDLRRAGYSDGKKAAQSGTRTAERTADHSVVTTAEWTVAWSETLTAAKRVAWMGMRPAARLELTTAAHWAVLRDN